MLDFITDFVIAVLRKALSDVKPTSLPAVERIKADLAYKNLTKSIEETIKFVGKNYKYYLPL